MEKKKTLNPLLAMTGNGKTLADNMMEVTGRPVGREYDNKTHAPEPAMPDTNSKECGMFIERIKKYTHLKEQGSAVWIATPVKKQLEQICAKAKTNVPIRALASAMLTAYIEEHKDELDTL